MKKTINYFLGFTLAVVLLSCGGSPADQIYGKWLNTSVSITNEDGSELSDDKAELAEKLEKGILEEETVYEFSKGDEFDTFTMKSNEGDKSGDFQAVELDGKLQLVLFDGEDESAMPTKITVDEITDSEMKTSFAAEGMKISYTYTKQ